MNKNCCILCGWNVLNHIQLCRETIFSLSATDKKTLSDRNAVLESILETYNSKIISFLHFILRFNNEHIF
jgi:hypothetical protein